MKRWWNCWLFHSWDKSRLVTAENHYGHIKINSFHPCRFCDACWEIPGGYFS